MPTRRSYRKRRGSRGRLCARTAMWIRPSRRAEKSSKRNTMRRCWRRHRWSHQPRWQRTATAKPKCGRRRKARKGRDAIAQALGLKKEDVTVHVTLLGGGFGRKSFPDFAVEAAVLSKKTGKPVK